MKKVLAFVLVLAMVLGSVSMAFAATYSDDAAITNKEAVAVLSGAGILEGDANGFRPADGLTRAEGATIVARMLLGKSDAAKLTTVVGPFSDVPATHWAAGYISYAVSQGIIDGYGNGTFGPEDPLTVAQFGKMMLTALGYNSQNQGFTGANWETNVGSVMVKAGLTDGVTLSGSNACVREVAAQIALNTLKANLVNDSSTGTTVSTGTVTVVTGKSDAKKLQWMSDSQANDKANYLAEGFGNDPIRFMNRYQGKLKYEATGDDFGRPEAYKWSYDGQKAFTKNPTDNLVAKYTTKQTQKTLYKLLDNLDAKNATCTAVFNTAKANNVTVTGASIGAIGIANVGDDFANTGNGTQIEVYYDSSKKEVTVVAYDYYLAKAAADYNASKDTLSVEVKSTGAAVAGVTKISKDDASAVTSIKENDYIVFTYAAGKVKSVALANKVTGDVSAYTADKNITVDSTSYSKAASYKGTAFDGISTGYDITLIVDPNNFVLATENETAKNQYVYIYQAAKEGALSTEYKATAYFVDGTKQTITLDAKADYDLASAGAVGDTGNLNAGWFNYSVKSNGKYKLTATNKATAVASAAGVSAGSISYVPGVINAANNETVFIVLKAGKTDATVYTGYKAVPGTSNTVTYAAVTKDANASGVAKYVFIQASGAITGAQTSDYLVVLKDGNLSVTTSGDKTYQTYGNAMLNGAEGTVEFNESVANAVTKGVYYDLSYDSDGRIDSAGSTVATTGAVADGFVAVTGVTKAAVSYSSGVMTIKNLQRGVSDNAKVYVYDGELTEVSVSNAKAALDEDVTFTAYIKFTTTDSAENKQIIEAVYFLK